MHISVSRSDKGYSVKLLSAQLTIQGEVCFRLKSDAVEFAELWRDWVGAQSIVA